MPFRHNFLAFLVILSKTKTSYSRNHAWLPCEI